MSQRCYSIFVLNIVMLCILSLTLAMRNSINSNLVQDSEYFDVFQLLHDNSTAKRRVKRYISRDSIFFKETELEIRERIGVDFLLDVKLLPKFGGKDAIPPYVNLIQVLSHSRSYRDGSVDGSFAHSTADTISVSVDPILHRFSKGKWTIYGGSRQHRCNPQLVYGNGYKVVFDCVTEGTYYAFFRVQGTYKDENDVVDGVPFRPPEQTIHFFVDPSFTDYFLDSRMFITDYESALLQDPESETNPWHYSDPFKIFQNSYCYRWGYRLTKENEVGFVHLEPNPGAIGGVYREYVLKVWIVDPSEVYEEELNSQAHLRPSAYSNTITRRFYFGGLVPCLRYAHSAVEVLSDAEYILTDSGGNTEAIDSVSLHGPHWKFRIRVYLDKIVTTLSDIVFTITPRQHSALYDCFISNVRVFIQSKSYVFLPAAKVRSTAINLDYSSISQVERRFLKENVINYYGHEVAYARPSYLKELNSTSIQTFSDPCLNQDLTVLWNGTFGMTTDFFTRNDLAKIVLPTFDKNRLGLRSINLQLSEAEVKSQMERSNNMSYTKDKDLRIKIFDFAYTPVDLIFLMDDSSLILHSMDLSLRGIGFNTITQKYKLGSLVKRRWCARSSTPKNHNMWVPAFSRDGGHFIVIVHVPLEGASVITQSDVSATCEGLRGSGNSSTNETTVSERRIHIDEEDDARIDRVVEAKLRTKSAELRIQRRDMNRRVIQRRTRRDIPEDQKTFWMEGNFVLDEGADPHYLSGDTDARNVRIAATGYERNNENIIFVVDSDFTRIRSNLEANGLSFDIDETVYATGTTMERPASNYRMLRIHSLEFTGVEKQFLLAVGFQSVEFPKELENINSTVVLICTFAVNDLPIVLETGLEEEMELEDVVVGFTGLIIRRLQTTKYNGSGPYTPIEEDYKDSNGREAKPLPMSSYTTILKTINTAIPLYVLRINDILLYASLDGSFAKPILAYEEDPTPNQPIQALPFLPFEEFDTVVTEQGIISVLSRKEYVGSTPVTANEVLIGSVLADEPLRAIQPFHVSNTIFQASTVSGEVIYGKLSYNDATDSFDGPPRTEILNIPFWSFLKGSFASSAGESPIPIGRSIVYEGMAPSTADPICPFASFDLFYVAYPYVEAGYTTRITAEVAFYGDVIPLEADIIVDFSEVQGVSVVVSSSLEVDHDQTIVRKTIEVETFIPDPILQTMYERHRSQINDDDTKLEQVRVFTITIRPSVLNLHCDKDNYFRTIQINVGCVPLSRMRFLAEAIPVRKINVVPWTKELESSDNFPTETWFSDSSSAASGISFLVLSKETIHKSQHKSFDCSHPKYCKIPVPAGRAIEDNVYGLSFRDVMIPKFEQFMTRHARRVTGNVVLYDILDSYKLDDTQMESNTTQFTAGCSADDDDWYDKMAQKSNFARKELSVNADIYRHFKNCFSEQGLKPIGQIQYLNDREYFMFNRSNRNAIQLKRKRNYIYVIRAVVVNTDYNRFTFCQKLDTFFVLQVVNIAQQQRVTSHYIWYIYIGIICLFLLILFCSYYYFATRKQWTVDLECKPIYDQQEEDKIVDELRKRYDSVPKSPYGRLAKRIAELEKIQRGAKQYRVARQEEREERLSFSQSKRAKSEGRSPTDEVGPSLDGSGGARPRVDSDKGRKESEGTPVEASGPKKKSQESGGGRRSDDSGGSAGIGETRNLQREARISLPDQWGPRESEATPMDTSGQQKRSKESGGGRRSSEDSSGSDENEESRQRNRTRLLSLPSEWGGPRESEGAPSEQKKPSQ